MILRLWFLDLRVFAVVNALFVLLPSSHAQSALQKSHIEANVPDASVFTVALSRDLVQFFKSSSSPTTDRVEFKLLRDGPTQSGVGYPKYYAWVKVFAGKQLLEQGAVRVAAVERTRFEVTNFIGKSQIQQANGSVEKVFPAPLVADIKSLANKP